MYKIYSLKKEKRKTLDSLLADDILGRQTIIYKNAENYGGNDDSLFILIEGLSDVFSRIAELKPEGLEEVKNSEGIYRQIKNEEDEAESGMGFMFGQ